MRKPTALEEKVVREVVNLVNINSANLSDIEYRRLLGRIIRRLYALRNLDYKKKKVKTDFTSVNNPKSMARVGLPRKK